MSDKEIVFKRDDLYDKIWTTPIVRMAKDYGISDVALAKICKKLKIPRPPRGYWAKLEYGKKVKRANLPAISSEEPNEYTHHEPWKPPYSVNTDSLVTEQFFSEKRIEVSDALANPHKLVREAYMALKKARPDQYGLIYTNWRTSLSLNISPASLDRTLRIADTFIKAFEAKGFKVSAGSESDPKSSVLINGKKVRFSLSESYRRAEHILTQEEKAAQENRSYWYPKKYDYIPTGILSIRIDAAGAYGKRKHWSDSKSGRLEEKLGEFIGGAILVAHILKLEQEKYAEEEQRREEERKRREELERRHAEEIAHWQELEHQATIWAKSKQITCFIQAVESALEGKDMAEEEKKRIFVWIRWAKEYANRINPVVSLFT